MRLRRGDQVAGLHAHDARNLMRRFDDAQPESSIGVWIDIGNRTGSEVARAFAAAGYLKISFVDRHGETWWESTTEGSALAQASFRQPITRATAQRHLGDVIDRAKRFNADELHVTGISELVVFGSYLDPEAQRLGDLDLGVTFRSRIPDTIAPVDQRQILLDYARATGAHQQRARHAVLAAEGGAGDVAQQVGGHQDHARGRTVPDRPVGGCLQARLPIDLSWVWLVDALDLPGS